MKNKFSGSVLILTVLLAALHPARADHRGATGVLNHPAANINDAYAFANLADPNNGTVVLAMTVNGLTPSGVNAVFEPGCLYQFKIDNTGDFVEDVVIQITFDQPTGSAFGAVQNFTVVGPVKPAKAGGASKPAKTKAGPITGPVVNVPLTGAQAGQAVNTFTIGTNGVKVFCGLRDDPFTFDEIFVRKILRGTLAAPNPANTRNPGIDFYAKMNCSAIIIEVPVAMLTGSLEAVPGQKQLNVWATTSLPTSTRRALKAPAKGEALEAKDTDAKTFVQYDRAALPCVSTFLIRDEDQNAFRVGQPRDDAAFFAEPARGLIQKMQLDPTSIASMNALEHLLDLRFPDVLSLNVTSNLGYFEGNARRPQDDVVSVELNLLTVGVVTNEGIPGSNGRVGGNDGVFISVFPFLAPPHLPAEPVPARN